MKKVSKISAKKKQKIDKFCILNVISSRIFQDKLLLVLCSAIHWKRKISRKYFCYFFFVRFYRAWTIVFLFIELSKVNEFSWTNEHHGIVVGRKFWWIEAVPRCVDRWYSWSWWVCERQRQTLYKHFLFSDSILTATCSVFFEIARISSISSNYWRESFAMASHHGWSTTVAAWTGQVRTGTFRFWDKIVSCTSFARNWEQSQTCRGNGTWSLGESWKFYHFIEGKSNEID